MLPRGREVFYSSSLTSIKYDDHHDGNNNINSEMIANIEKLIFEMRNYYKERKEKEFNESLLELKKHCSLLSDAMEKKLNEKSWNFLIQHFCRNETFNEEAIFWFNRIMKERKLARPNSFTLNSVIKSFSDIGDVETCEEILKELESQEQCNVFSYVHYLKACLKNENSEKAFHVIERMQKHNIEPNFGIFIPLLKEATKCNNKEFGLNICQLIKKSNLTGPKLSQSMATFALKVRLPDLAIEEYEKMKKCGSMNVVTWTCLIQAYIQKNEIKKAIDIINEMEKHDIKPNATTFNILLSACANSNMFEEGKLIHKLAKKSLNTFTIELSNAIINFYTKCGHADIAIAECEILKKNGLMDIVTWNCLIQAYIQKNEIKKAIFIINDMRKYEIKPDSRTFTILLTVCANRNMFEEGKLIHELAQKTLGKFTIEFSTSLINFYTKCGHPDIAISECEILKKNRMMNVVTWTCLIQAYIQKNEIKKAIDIVREMSEHRTNPDPTIFTILLSACANSNMFEEGKLIHELAQKYHCESTIEFSTAIINFYTKCGYSDIAIAECEKIKSSRMMNVVTWTCLIQAYIQKNQVEKAIDTVNEMIKYDIKPDSTTFIILLSACANSNMFEEGKLIHKLAKKSFKEFTIELYNAIINFYTKCGHADIAIAECETLKKNGLMDIVTWNCLIQAYIPGPNNTDNPIYEHGLNKAFKVYQEMKQEMKPDIFTYQILLSACSEYVASNIGLKIIEDIRHYGIDNHEEIIAAMVYFYSRIGQKKAAQQLFDNLVRRKDETMEPLSTITYGNMLSCYAQHGQRHEAKKLFNEMVEKKVLLNEIIFIILLNTYSHCGMVDDAIQLYNSMKSKHKISPTNSIDCVMVDVYSRAGKFQDAEKLINNRANIDLWGALMGGCRKFNNIELGEKVFNKMTSIDEKIPSPYILLSNIYTYHGLNDKANEIRELMQQREIKKAPGIVWYEENGTVYKFISGMTEYDMKNKVEKMLDEIYRRIMHEGYKPDTRWVTNTKALSEKEKEQSLSGHAEKIAIAHAFVLNPNRKKIILTKNLRVCNDCHSATAFISKVMDVEIIVRDASRYHHFKDGKCSCDNYW